MKTLTVIGARPQFIKASPISVALKEAGFEQVLLHTGQHYDINMSQIFFDELAIAPPDINLGIGSGSHAEQTAGMLVGIEQAINYHKPNWVVIYGDTNSTVAAALAAAKLHVSIAHVEAGLRSFNRTMPEEINRVIADSISSILFAPTQDAINNLRNEGIPNERVHLVGDVMYDASLMHGRRADIQSKILDKIGVQPHKFILATVHRAENTDIQHRCQAIFEGLDLISHNMPVVLPMHPRTKATLERYGILDKFQHSLRIIDPVGYLDMIKLEKSAALIATDSGGVQKEAFFHKVPCVTLRDETEWVELVDLGWNKIIPPISAENIADAIRSMLGTVGQNANPYGEGNAANKIAQILAEY